MSTRDADVTDVQVDTGHKELLAVAAEIAKVIIGKSDVIEKLLIAIVAGGHCLIEDVPGVGKTMLVRAAAKALGCDFKRIQFTPDLLPSDVTGVSIYHPHTQAFEFRPGPVFAQVVLADEINRASPRTQAALLEAMEERCVTVDGVSHTLPEVFFVLATENPMDMEGTFPLPESQLDRFLFKLHMGYPSQADEVALLDKNQPDVAMHQVQPCATVMDVARWRSEAQAVHVDMQVRQYLVRITQATRAHPDIRLGASPRATVSLFHAAQAQAFIRGRSYVVPDDIRDLCPLVLSHRMLLRPEASFTGLTVADVILDVLNRETPPIGTDSSVDRK